MESLIQVASGMACSVPPTLGVIDSEHRGEGENESRALTRMNRAISLHRAFECKTAKGHRREALGPIDDFVRTLVQRLSPCVAELGSHLAQPPFHTRPMILVTPQLELNLELIPREMS